MSCPHGNPIGGCDTCDEVDAAFEAGKQSALAEQQTPVAFSQFLSDVVTAAGLLAHGKTDKSLAARISEFAFRLRTSPQPAQQQQELTKAMIDAAERIDWSDSDVRGNIVNMWQAMCAAAPQPAQQEPVKARNEFEQWCASSGHDYCFDLNEIGEYQWADAQGAYEAYWARSTSPPAQRQPLTDEEFLELILRTGTRELVGVATFVGGSIQMQGKIGLLRSTKIIKDFVEAAHGITGDRHVPD